MAADTESEAVAAVHNVAGIVAQFADLDGHNAATLAALERALRNQSNGLDEDGLDEDGIHRQMHFGHNGIDFVFNTIFQNLTGEDKFRNDTFLPHGEAYCAVSRVGSNGMYATTFVGRGKTVCLLPC